MRRFLIDTAATERLAESLLAALPDSVAGWTVLLSGDLGSGKSTFARAFIRASGHKGPVPSPTYTLVEPYATARGQIYHVDLYRIAAAEELHFLGWNELDDGCRLVEWPERAPELARSADLALTLTYEAAGRGAHLCAISERGATLLAGHPRLDSKD